MRYITLVIFTLVFKVSSCYSQLVWTVYDTLNSSLPNMSVSRVCEGQNGIIWASTYKGLVKIDGANWTVYDSSSTGHALQNIFSMAYDKHNNMLWLANPYNLFRFDGIAWMRWSISPLVGYSIDMAIDSYGKVWQSHFQWPLGGGISSFDGVSFSYYDTLNSPMPDNFIFNIDIAPNDDIWLSTQSSGLIKFSGGSNWTVFDSTNSGLPSNYVRSSTVDSSGVVWIYGSHSQGISGFLSSFDGISWNTLDSNVCAVPFLTEGDIAVDQYNRKWLGSSYAALKIFGDTTCLHFDTGNSPLISDVVTDVLIATDGTAWLGTYYGGLVRIDNTVGVEESESNDQFELFPNPSNGEFYLNFPLNVKAKMELYDSKGMLVYDLNLGGEKDTHKVTIPEKITSGFYICRIFSDKKSFSKKLILER